METEQAETLHPDSRRVRLWRFSIRLTVVGLQLVGLTLVGESPRYAYVMLGAVTALALTEADAWSRGKSETVRATAFAGTIACVAVAWIAHLSERGRDIIVIGAAAIFIVTIGQVVAGLMKRP